MAHKIVSLMTRTCKVLIQIYAATGTALARLLALTGVFSFSSSSLGTGLSLIVRPDADTFILACSKAVLEARRCKLEVGFAGDGRANEDESRLFAGVGVPMEVRLVRAGGGPIDPAEALTGVEPEVVPFARTLFPRTFEIFAGVSVPRTLSFPVSDSADGGRGIPGVVKMEESRRWAIFDV